MPNDIEKFQEIMKLLDPKTTIGITSIGRKKYEFDQLKIQSYFNLVDTIYIDICTSNVGTVDINIPGNHKFVEETTLTSSALPIGKKVSPYQLVDTKFSELKSGDLIGVCRSFETPYVFTHLLRFICTSSSSTQRYRLISGSATTVQNSNNLLFKCV